MQPSNHNRVFVRRGSRAWLAWCAYSKAHGGRPAMYDFPSDHHCDAYGRPARGRYLESLFPPDDAVPLFQAKGGSSDLEAA